MSATLTTVSKRLLTLDLMRGYFLCVILFNHLFFYPSIFEYFTGQGLLYVSTAEGFFAVSGIVLGIIRGRKLIDQPMLVVTKKVLKRAAVLYLASIVLTLLFTIIGWLFVNNPGVKYGVFPAWTNFFDLFWQTITLQYTYGWTDFLRYYALFLLFTPLALYLLRKGLWYILMLLSVVVWSLFPYNPWPPTISQPISWQIIFFGGLTIGFYWDMLAAKWRGLPARAQTSIGISLFVAFLLTAAASALLVFGYDFPGALGTQLTAYHREIEQLFDKDQLPLARILLGIVWFWGLYWFVHRFEPFIAKRLGWLLLPLGTNSLYTYIVSGFVVFIAHLFIASPGTDSFLLNLVLSAGALGLVLLAVKKKFLMNIIPR